LGAGKKINKHGLRKAGDGVARRELGMNLNPQGISGIKGIYEV
jgi:hypothetical protein